MEEEKMGEKMKNKMGIVYTYVNICQTVSTLRCCNASPTTLLYFIELTCTFNYYKALVPRIQIKMSNWQNSDRILRESLQLLDHTGQKRGEKLQGVPRNMTAGEQFRMSSSIIC